MLDAARELQLTQMRWPGGNFAAGYDWRDGIGPKDKRPKRMELAWGVVESNQVGTDEWVQLNKEIGTENVVCINMGTGTLRRRPLLGRILQRARRHLLGGQARRIRPPRALRHQVLVPRQRGRRRALDPRPQERRRLREVRRRGGQGDAPQLARHQARVHRQRSLLLPGQPRLDGVDLEGREGPVSASPTMSPCTATGTTPTTTTSSWASAAWTWRSGSKSSPARSKAVDAIKKKQPMYISVDEWAPPFRGGHLSTLALAEYFNAFIRHADVVKMANYTLLTSILGRDPKTDADLQVAPVLRLQALLHPLPRSGARDVGRLRHLPHQRPLRAHPVPRRLLRLRPAGEAGRHQRRQPAQGPTPSPPTSRASPAPSPAPRR